MTLGLFRTYLISLLLVLALCGARLANTWDYSDQHDSHILHIDHADPHDTDMDDTKHKQLNIPTIAVSPYVLPFPELITYRLNPSSVQLLQPQSYTALSLPSRASPD